MKEFGTMLRLLLAGLGVLVAGTIGWAITVGDFSAAGTWLTTDPWGIVTLADLYFGLREDSVNRGELDHDAFLNGRPQAIRTNPDGAFQLFRIGDAVSSRNTHAAIYDALRLMKDL